MPSIEANKFSGPLVSVILPTYNRAHLIAESILSVLAQTYKNFELIVVDDGSTDNTDAVIAQFSDSRIRYIQQPNRGRSNARNHALSLARGELITFLDSDDLYLPEKIACQVEYLQSHPGTGMAYTSAYCIDELSNRLEHQYIASVSGLIYESIAFFTPVTITLPTVMTYKSVINKVGGFDEAMHRFEDTDMWRRIALNYRIDALPEFTCMLRTHCDNHLLNQDPEQIISALEYYDAKLHQDTIEPSVLNRGLARLYGYYSAALKSVPEFQDYGERLFNIACDYEVKAEVKLREVPLSKMNFMAFNRIMNFAKCYMRKIKNARYF